jgi:hypothetical protein
LIICYIDYPLRIHVLFEVKRTPTRRDVHVGHDASLQPTCGEMSTLIEEKKGCKEKRVLLFDNDNTLAFVKTGKERRSRRGQGQMGTKQESTFKRRGGGRISRCRHGRILYR